MAAFKFRLDAVLKHRENIERERQGQHAKMQAALVSAQLQRDDLLGRRDLCRQKLADEHTAMAVDDLRAIYVHLDFLDRALVASDQRVAQCAAAADRTRLALVDAARDRKVLDTLRERQAEAHAVELAQYEQRESDDQNARIFERAAASEGSRT